MAALRARAGPGREPFPDDDSAPTTVAEPAAVTLFLASARDLRCSYCYARSGDAVPEWMPLELATRAIGFVSANAVMS